MRWAHRKASHSSNVSKKVPGRRRRRDRLRQSRTGSRSSAGMTSPSLHRTRLRGLRGLRWPAHAKRYRRRHPHRQTPARATRCTVLGAHGRQTRPGSAVGGEVRPCPSRPGERTSHPRGQSLATCRTAPRTRARRTARISPAPAPAPWAAPAALLGRGLLKVCRSGGRARRLQRQRLQLGLLQAFRRQGQAGRFQQQCLLRGGASAGATTSRRTTSSASRSCLRSTGTWRSGTPRRRPA
mmetsp:Transcript_10794/g.33405  ORF Transcript_10794/g.33405 Transcript_10794/m.33405 type:complete len:239 (+) Transcript_10794:51-767(+)